MQILGSAGLWGNHAIAPRSAHLGEWYKAAFLSGSDGARAEVEVWVSTSGPASALPLSAAV